MFNLKITSTHINLYISLGGGKTKKISIRKPYVKNFDKYIKKYAYVLENYPKVETSNKHQNAIWQLWLQGEENAPDIVKKCFESVRYFCPDKEIIVLNLNNLKDYIDIPDFIQEKSSKGIIPHANFSDYVRLCLLAKYGGTWIDSTVLLTDEIPKKIFETELFFFKSAHNCENYSANIIDLLVKKKFRLFPKKVNKNKSKSISNWFINAKPENELILATLHFFSEYWKNENELNDYFMFHKFVRYCFESNSKFSNLYDEMISFPNKYAFLMHEFGRLKYSDENFYKILKISPIHKLTYRSPEKQSEQWWNKILNLNFADTKGSFDKNKNY